MEFLTSTLDIVSVWFIDNGLKVVGIGIGVLLILRFGNLFIEKIIRHTIHSGRYLSKTAEKKREDTLIRVFSTALNVFVLIVASIMILGEVGIDTTPLIASAGIVGIAVGFGGQYLIKDLITGFFIILENQYRVGDVVCFGDTCGLVEDINLRVTILRDLNGTVHHVPNGEVTISSNLSKDKANVNLNIGVSYTTDIPKVEKIINTIGEEMAKDPKWKDDIRKAPAFLRIDEFADSAIIIKILGETEPLRQWDVAGELRKRLKVAFDKNDIEIPFPQRVIHTAPKA